MQYVPTVPIFMNGFSLGHILVDTGSMVTLVPSVLQDVLGVDRDASNALTMSGANGSEFKAFPSKTKN